MGQLFLRDKSFIPIFRCSRYFLDAVKTEKFSFQIDAIKKAVTAINFLPAIHTWTDQFKHPPVRQQICTSLPANIWINRPRGGRCSGQTGYHWRKDPQGRGTSSVNNCRTGPIGCSRPSFRLGLAALSAAGASNWRRRYKSGRLPG